MVSRVRLPVDFVIYDEQGNRSVLLEAKRRFGLDRAWAMAWHQMLCASLGAPPAASVVFVAPDRIYAWKQGATPAAPPDWEFDAKPWLEPYFARLKLDAQAVDGWGFEQVVGLWLRDLVEAGVQDGSAPGEMFHALRGGQVVQQEAA